VADLGLYLPGQAVFVNNDFLAENPELVQGFVEATMQGYRYADENPEEAAQIMVKYYPEIEAEVIEQKWDIIERVWYSPATEEHGFGYNDPQAYENLQTILMDTDLLDEPIDLDSALNNELLEGIPLEERPQPGDE
jgi:NitT/TauT family transport system substrate-binding protein